MIKYANFEIDKDKIFKMPVSEAFVIHHFTLDREGYVKNIALYNFDKTSDNRYIFILFTEHNIKEILKYFRNDILNVLRSLKNDSEDIEFQTNFIRSFLPYLTNTEKLYIEL